MTQRPIPADDLAHVLANTRELWTRARGKRVFLTGGTGFFGAWMVESFVHANNRLGLGAELIVLTRDCSAAIRRLPALESPGVVLHKGDVREFDAPDGPFHLVVHGAAESSRQTHAGNQHHMFETLVQGTRRTLALARDTGASAFLLLSSGAVYGRQPASVTHVTETFRGGPDVSDPRSSYAEGKRAAEVMAAIEADRSGLSVRVARCFAFVGPHLPLDAHFAIGNFIRDGMRGGPIRIHGDGTAVRSYLYAADLTVWLWTLALSPKARGAYNVGSEIGMSILDTARAVAEVCAPAAEVVVEGKAAPGTEPQRYVPSTARAREELGVTQLIDTRESIHRTVEWHQFVESEISPVDRM